jgi:hypothetical protein
MTPETRARRAFGYMPADVGRHEDVIVALIATAIEAAEREGQRVGEMAERSLIAGWLREELASARGERVELLHELIEKLELYSARQEGR